METQNIPSYKFTDDLVRFIQWLDETIGLNLHTFFDTITAMFSYLYKFIFYKYELTRTEQSIRTLVLIILVFGIFALISYVRTHLDAEQKFKSSKK